MTSPRALSHMDKNTAVEITDTAARRTVEGFEQACADVARAMANRVPSQTERRDFENGEWIERVAANEVKS